MTALRPPGSELHEFDYSGVDQTTLYRAPDTGAGDRETQYSYNFDHQLETITQPGDVAVELDYDAGGRLWHITQPRGTSTLGYSASTGQLTSLTSPDTVTLAFGYNGSLPTSETWSGSVGGSVALDWNPELQPCLQTVTAGGSTDTAGFAYDRDGLLRRAGALGVFPRSTNGLLDSTQAGAVISRQDYDGYGDLANLRYRAGAGVLLQQSVQRDALGRIEQLDDAAVDSSRTWAYAYDLAGRLEQVWRDGLLVRRIWYDANGNPDSVQGPGGAGDRITTEVDPQDRLLRYGDTGYSYTPNGELAMRVAGTDTTRYTYDALGNLVTVVLPSGQRIDYLIDGRNRRVARKIDGVMERQWLYQNGVSPVAELDGVGQLLWRFVYGTRAHVPDLAVRGDTVYRVVSDHLGSVRALVRASDGVVRAWRNYDAWGSVVVSSGPAPCLGFAGGIHDSLTGLVRYGARDYDPFCARWTGPDPVGFTAGDACLYAYSKGDPANAYDPTGKWSVQATGALMGGIMGGIAASHAGGDAGDITRGVLVGAGVGLVSTIVPFPAAADLIGGTLAGASYGFFGNLLEQKISGQPLGELDWGSASVSAFAGAIGGAIGAGAAGFRFPGNQGPFFTENPGMPLVAAAVGGLSSGWIDTALHPRFPRDRGVKGYGLCKRTPSGLVPVWP